MKCGWRYWGYVPELSYEVNLAMDMEMGVCGREDCEIHKVKDKDKAEV